MAGNGGGNLLPPELQGCEYLQGDESSYIRLGYNINNINTISIKCLADANDVGICGNRTSTNNRLDLYTSNNYYVFTCLNSVQNGQYQSNINYSSILEFEFDKQNRICSFNGQQQAITNNFLTTNTNILLFSIQGVYFSTAKIYELTINANRIVSCYVKSGQTFTDNKGVECSAGTPGMFDIVNSVFYTNDGTGTFTHGADIEI